MMIHFLRIFCLYFIALDCFGAEVEHQFSFDALFGGNSQSFQQDSIFNPGNQILKQSTGGVFTQIRWNEKLRLNSFSATLRPRATGTVRQRPTTNPTSEETINYQDVFTTEAYLSWTPTSQFQFHLGRQNFQWGPAEFTSPSNFIFNESTSQLELYFETRGKTLARLNLSLGSHWSYIQMVELPPLRDSKFGLKPAAEESEKSVLSKLEANWNSGADFLGIVVGTHDRDRKRTLLGMYAAFTPSSAWQFYFDGLTERGSESQRWDAGSLSSKSVADSSQMFGLFDLGARYTFDGGTEMRFEYLRNDNGFDRQEQNEIRSSLSSGGIQQALALPVALSSTRILYGKDYGYLTLRWSNTGKLFKLFDQPTYSVRAMVAGSDGSQFLSGNFESGIGNSGTAYAFLGSAIGVENSDLKRTLNSICGIAYKHSF